MLGRGLTSILWGVVADRYGRKPVIILSTMSVSVLQSILIFNSILFILTLMPPLKEKILRSGIGFFLLLFQGCVQYFVWS